MSCNITPPLYKSNFNFLIHTFYRFASHQTERSMCKHATSLSTRNNYISKIMQVCNIIYNSLNSTNQHAANIANHHPSYHFHDISKYLSFLQYLIYIFPYIPHQCAGFYSVSFHLFFPYLPLLMMQILTNSLIVHLQFTTQSTKFISLQIWFDKLHLLVVNNQYTFQSYIDCGKTILKITY